MMDTAHPSRYVRLRCPICDYTSPTCDQSSDIRRDLLQRWWQSHLKTHTPNPIIERADPPTTDDGFMCDAVKEA